MMYDLFYCLNKFFSKPIQELTEPMMSLTLKIKSITLKQLLLLLFLFCAFSCSKNETTCADITLGQEIELAHDTQICIDNVEYTFKADDQRCPCNWDCFLPGEFVLLFEDLNGEVVYTFHESPLPPIPNETPPFAKSMSISNIVTETFCGNQDLIDDVRFILLFE